MKKKVLFVTLALLLAASLIAGCGGGAANNATTAATTAATAAATAAATSAAATTTAAATEPEPSFEPITLTVIGNVGSSTFMQNGIMEDPVSLYIREHTGISIDLTMIPDSGDSQNKVNAMIAANDLPDILNNNGGNTQLQNLVGSDLIWPLDDLIDKHAPNIKADNFAMAAMLQRKISSPDGNMYLFGMNRGYWDSSAFGPQRGFYIRWDLYKQLGYPDITNTMELCDVLAKMCELEPTNKNDQKTYAAAVWNNAFSDAAFLPQAIMMGIATGPSHMLAVDINTKTIMETNPIKDKESYLWQALKWCNKLNQLGLFDPDSFTQTYQNYMDKTTSGQYMMGALTWSNGGANTEFINDGTPEKQLICLPSNIFGWENVILYDYMVGGERGWAIAKTCKTPERAVQLFDFMSTFEFSRVAHNGPEGMNWTMEGGVAKPKPEYVALSGEDAVIENQLATGARIFRLFTGYASATNNPLDNQTVDLLSSTRPLTDTHKDFISHYGKSTMDDVYTADMKTYVKSTIVNWGVLPEDLITYQTNLTDYLNQSYVNCTLAKTDSEFATEQEKLISGLEPYKIDDLFKTYYDNAMSTADKVKPIYDLLGD